MIDGGVTKGIRLDIANGECVGDLLVNGVLTHLTIKAVSMPTALGIQGTNYIWTCNDIKILSYDDFHRKWEFYMPNDGSNQDLFFGRCSSQERSAFNPSQVSSLLFNVLEILSLLYFESPERGIEYKWENNIVYVIFHAPAMESHVKYNFLTKGRLLRYKNKQLFIIPAVHGKAQESRFNVTGPWTVETLFPLAEKIFNDYIFDLYGL